MWGHAHSSKDLVKWEHAEVALEPNAGLLDGDGCFSGCVALDTDGAAVMMYTGVRLRKLHLEEEEAELPPPDFDVGLQFIESQLAAVAGR